MCSYGGRHKSWGKKLARYQDVTDGQRDIHAVRITTASTRFVLSRTKKNNKNENSDDDK